MIIYIYIYMLLVYTPLDRTFTPRVVVYRTFNTRESQAQYSEIVLYLEAIGESVEWPYMDLIRFNHSVFTFVDTRPHAR